MEKKLIRCRACGYIMTEGSHHTCPACGVGEKMFEPWDDKVPVNRRKVLDLHIHPIIVHAPQALGFLMLFISAVFLVINLAWRGNELGMYLLTTLKVLAVLLPVFVIGGFLSGLLDGWYRYKSVTTPLLVKKMVVGCAFFVVAGLMLVLVFQESFPSSTGLQLLFVLANLVAFGCTAILGLWGASLVGAVMPGPFPKMMKAGETKSE